MIFIALFASFLLAGLVSLPLSAGTDAFFPEDNPRQLPPLEESISKKGREKAEALANYALGYRDLKKDRRFSKEVMDRLIHAVEKDPYATAPLKLLWAKWTTNGKPSDLVKALLPIAKAHPRAADLNTLVANSLRVMKKNDEAIDLLEASAEALDLGEDCKAPLNKQIEVVQALSELYVAAKRWDDGEELFEDFLENGEVAKSYLARLEAAKFFAECADQGPDGFFAGWSKRRRRKRLEENLLALEKIAGDGDVSVSALRRTIPILKRYSMPDRAERMVFARLLSHPKDLSTYLVLASMYDDFRRYADATRVWRKVADYADGSKLSLAWRMVFGRPLVVPWLPRYKQGLAAMKQGWSKEALRAFDWCAIASPGNPAVILQTAYVYVDDCKYLKALRIMRRLKGKDPDVDFLRAVCLDYLERPDEAFEAMRLAEEGFAALAEKKKGAGAPDNFWWVYVLIGLKVDARDKIESIARRFIDSDPDDPVWNNFLGYMFADWNVHLDEAKKMITKALKKEPESAAYLDSMAWVLYRKGKFDEALDYIEEAVEKDSPLPDAVILDHAGDINAALGHRAEAIKLWKRALATYSDDLDYAATRAKLLAAEKAEGR